MQEYKTLKTLAKEQEKNYQDDIILAMVDDKLRELSKEADQDSDISFVTVADRDGKKTYRRSLMLVLQKAVQKLYGSEGCLRVMHSLGEGYYCEIFSMPCENSKSQEDGSSSIINQADKVMQSKFREFVPVWRKSWNRTFQSKSIVLRPVRQKLCLKRRECMIRLSFSITEEVQELIFIVWMG